MYLVQEKKEIEQRQGKDSEQSNAKIMERYISLQEELTLFCKSLKQRKEKAAIDTENGKGVVHTTKEYLVELHEKYFQHLTLAEREIFSQIFNTMKEKVFAFAQSYEEEQKKIWEQKVFSKTLLLEKNKYFQANTDSEKARIERSILALYVQSTKEEVLTKKERKEKIKALQITLYKEDIFFAFEEENSIKIKYLQKKYKDDLKDEDLKAQGKKLALLEKKEESRRSQDINFIENFYSSAYKKAEKEFFLTGKVTEFLALNKYLLASQAYDKSQRVLERIDFYLNYKSLFHYMRTVPLQNGARSILAEGELENWCREEDKEALRQWEDKIHNYRILARDADPVKFFAKEVEKVQQEQRAFFQTEMTREEQIHTAVSLQKASGMQEDELRVLSLEEKRTWQAQYANAPVKEQQGLLNNLQLEFGKYVQNVVKELELCKSTVFFMELALAEPFFLNLLTLKKETADNISTKVTHNEEDIKILQNSLVEKSQLLQYTQIMREEFPFEECYADFDSAIKHDMQMYAAYKGNDKTIRDFENFTRIVIDKDMFLYIPKKHGTKDISVNFVQDELRKKAAMFLDKKMKQGENIWINQDAYSFVLVEKTTKKELIKDAAMCVYSILKG